jgi:glycerophosphoryl diester phosphodiesterase
MTPMSLLCDPTLRPIIAHRGASARAPENTLPAFALALEEGAEALELDVHVSADDVPVVIHDPTLDRTTDRTGAVAELPLARIREADAGARFSPDGGRTFPWRGRGVRVPTLDEVLDAFPTVPVIVEIKSVAACAAVARTLHAHAAEDRCLLMSFDPLALGPFHAPPWVTGATSHEALRLLAGAPLGRAPRDAYYRALSVPERYHGIPIPLGLLARAARRIGRPVHVWVVDSPARAERLWKAGVAGIVTNTPREMRALRDRV